MKVYIIRKLHWEYQDYNNIYEIVEEEPVRAYRSKTDAELACQILNIEDRQNWKPPCQTITLEPMTDQDFYEVVEMDLADWLIISTRLPSAPLVFMLLRSSGITGGKRT